MGKTKGTPPRPPGLKRRRRKRPSKKRCKLEHILVRSFLSLRCVRIVNARGACAACVFGHRLQLRGAFSIFNSELSKRNSSRIILFLLTYKTTARTHSTMIDRSVFYRHQTHFEKCARKLQARYTFRAQFYSSSF